VKNYSRKEVSCDNCALRLFAFYQCKDNNNLLNYKEIKAKYFVKNFFYFQIIFIFLVCIKIYLKEKVGTQLIKTNNNQIKEWEGYDAVALKKIHKTCKTSK